MANGLIPCPECNRHLRRNEVRCPFCGTDVLVTMAATPERVMPVARLGRSALFAFAAVSVGAVGCSSGAIPAPLYGAPAPMNGGAGGILSEPPYGTPTPIIDGVAGTKDAGGADAAAADAASGAGGTFHGGPP
jgi:hypothetical protein